MIPIRWNSQGKPVAYENTEIASGMFQILGMINGINYSIPSVKKRFPIIGIAETNIYVGGCGYDNPSNFRQESSEGSLLISNLVKVSKGNFVKIDFLEYNSNDDFAKMSVTTIIKA